MRGGVSQGVDHSKGVYKIFAVIPIEAIVVTWNSSDSWFPFSHKKTSDKLLVVQIFITVYYIRHTERIVFVTEKKSTGPVFQKYN